MAVVLGMSHAERIDLGHPVLYGLLGPVVLLGTRDYPAPPTWPLGGHGEALFADARKLSIISTAAGGEVRGYWLAEHRASDEPHRPAHLCVPCYTGEWREVDALVERATGRRVAPYRVGPGGGVERAPLTPDDVDGQLLMFRLDP